MTGCQPTVYLKKHNLKVESYVLFGGFAKDLNQWDSFLDSSEGPS